MQNYKIKSLSTNQLLLKINKLLLKFVKNLHICDMTFANKLLGWYRVHGRDLPWRNTSDPYVIWLSEIILQQTRVEQGRPYFEIFLARFPEVKSFAEANEEEILRLWQGLGYYSRARNMHKAAKQVMEQHQGIFPTKYVDLLQLRGIGEYTAAAIASFSANEPRAVLDGNVFRVLARVFGVDQAINSNGGKKIFQSLADELLSSEHPGEYNHAIMDFGATHCKPKLPLCETCIFRLECKALGENRVDGLPIKLKGKASRNRYFHYFILENNGKILLSKRPDGDVWANLHEFPLLETDCDCSLPDIYKHPDFLRYFAGASITEIYGPVRHILSHQNIFARFYLLSNIIDSSEKKSHWTYVNSEKIDTLAKHKLIFTFWDKYYMS